MLGHKLRRKPRLKCKALTSSPLLPGVKVSRYESFPHYRFEDISKNSLVKDTTTWIQRLVWINDMQRL